MALDFSSVPINKNQSKIVGGKLDFSSVPVITKTAPTQVEKPMIGVDKYKPWLEKRGETARSLMRAEEQGLTHPAATLMLAGHALDAPRRVVAGLVEYSLNTADENETKTAKTLADTILYATKTGRGIGDVLSDSKYWSIPKGPSQKGDLGVYASALAKTIMDIGGDPLAWPIGKMIMAVKRSASLAKIETVTAKELEKMGVKHIDEATLKGLDVEAQKGLKRTQVEETIKQYHETQAMLNKEIDDIVQYTQKPLKDIVNKTPTGEIEITKNQIQGAMRVAKKQGKLTEDFAKASEGIITDKYAANINKIRLGLSEEGGAVLDKAVANNIDEITRGQTKVTHKKLKKLADVRKYDPDLMYSTNALERETATLQVRDRMATLIEHLEAYEKNKLTPNKAELLELNELLRKYSPRAREMGQELSMLNVGARSERGKLTEALLSEIQKVEKNNVKIVEEMAKVKWDDHKSVAHFYRTFVKPGFKEFWDFTRFQSMLSSPFTQVVNASTNLGQTIIPVAEKAVTANLDWLRNTVGKIGGKEIPREYFLEESKLYTKHALASIKPAWENALQVLAGKRMPTNLDFQRMPLFSPYSTAGKWEQWALSWPTKMMEASDMFFKTIIEGGEKEAIKFAKEMGAVKRFTTTKGVVQQTDTIAKDIAMYKLFRGDLFRDGQGFIGDRLDDLTTGILSQRGKLGAFKDAQTGQRYVGLDMIIPFVKTPMEIFKQGLDYSPAGILNLVSGTNKLEKASKIMIGTATSYALLGWAMDGRLSGRQPKNSPIPPYSVKIGDNWWSFDKFGVLSYPMAMIAAVNDSLSDAGTSVEKKINAFQDTMLGVVAFLTNQSYMQGVSNVLDAMKGEKYALDKILATPITQVQPYRAATAWMNNLILDHRRRDIQTFRDKIADGIPFWSRSVPQRVDDKGRPVNVEHWLWNSMTSVRQYPSDYSAEKRWKKKQKISKETSDINKELKQKEREERTGIE